MKEKEDIFRFKQFQIIQNQNVHRVGTDGVLLGAWTDANQRFRILDIGTGTGLIAIMLAQRFSEGSLITAIEPDQSSFDLAWQNVRQSPFSNRIKVINNSLENFQPTNHFDLIVCNPPFFAKSLKPPSQQRARERHSESLPYQNLIDVSKRLLNPDGSLAVILPVTEGNRFTELISEAGFQIKKKTAVFSKQGKPQERWLLEFSLDSAPSLVESTLTIQKDNGQWTDGYRVLTKDFYLDF